MFPFLLSILLFLFGVLTFARGMWKHSSKAKCLGGGIIVLLSILFEADYALDSAFEWNPSIRNDAEIIGKWSDKSEILTLAANKTFHYQTPEHVTDGTWTRDDWNLHLIGNGYLAKMRFVQFHGQYRIITHPPVGGPGEMDMWSGIFGLRKN